MRKKDRTGKNILHVLKLFLFLEELQPLLKNCSYIKVETWTNSFYVQRTASERCCTKT